MSKTLAFVDDQNNCNGPVIECLKRDMPELTILLYPDLDEFLQALAQGVTVDAVMMDGYFDTDCLGPYYTERLIKLYPNIVVIGYSGESKLKDSFLNRGARYFVSKRDDLFEKVRQIKEILNS